MRLESPKEERWRRCWAAELRGEGSSCQAKGEGRAVSDSDRQCRPLELGLVPWELFDNDSGIPGMSSPPTPSSNVTTPTMSSATADISSSMAKMLRKISVLRFASSGVRFFSAPEEDSGSLESSVDSGLLDDCKGWKFRGLRPEKLSL
eukprot:CAMPEP_0197456672 /NCGR_PEP_ID=MMETSP1175-20131217/43979_1 /TAXON_ID=1003142 /ORGANISM="Triceratium dubium, Strain CCMP147" /LENGTH=147 /DNA_ID=CAMNT_0042990807 /DNA_START=183 /DNA_END=626 /DNA_ORIENTATION=+